MLECAGDEEEVLGHYGEFVQDEDVVGFDGADGEGWRRVLEGVEWFFSIAAAAVVGVA